MYRLCIECLPKGTGSKYARGVIIYPLYLLYFLIYDLGYELFQHILTWLLRPQLWDSVKKNTWLQTLTGSLFDFVKWKKLHHRQIAILNWDSLKSCAFWVVPCSTPSHMLTMVLEYESQHWSKSNHPEICGPRGPWSLWALTPTICRSCSYHGIPHLSTYHSISWPENALNLGYFCSVMVHFYTKQTLFPPPLRPPKRGPRSGATTAAQRRQPRNASNCCSTSGKQGRSEGSCAQHASRRLKNAGKTGGRCWKTRGK